MSRLCSDCTVFDAWTAESPYVDVPYASVAFLAVDAREWLRTAAIRSFPAEPPTVLLLLIRQSSDKHPRSTPDTQIGLDQPSRAREPLAYGLDW